MRAGSGGKPAAQCTSARFCATVRAELRCSFCGKKPDVARAPGIGSHTAGRQWARRPRQATLLRRQQPGHHRQPGRLAAARWPAQQQHPALRQVHIGKVNELAHLQTPLPDHGCESCSRARTAHRRVKPEAALVELFESGEARRGNVRQAMSAVNGCQVLSPVVWSSGQAGHATQPAPGTSAGPWGVRAGRQGRLERHCRPQPLAWHPGPEWQTAACATRPGASPRQRPRQPSRTPMPRPPRHPLCRTAWA
jgi:hypothetical protein